MQKIEFNLLEEPWIRVLHPDGHMEEVSLTDALLKAHTYTDLAGETAAQDVAVLRLLLAVLHTVFSRVDENGEPAPLKEPDDALVRWDALWRLKALPAQPIAAYFKQWRDRFWLFHPERPFYQVPEAEIGTEYGAAKLNGEVLESGNKLRLFSAYTGLEKSKLSYAQAARWLLYTNGFDDASGKPKKSSDEKLLSPGTGWLGKLGLIALEGENLFETLLLNLVLLQDGERLWNAETPCWELDKVRSGQRTEIPLPDNAAALLTLQSRRLLLCREREAVTGYRLLGGDFFQKENAFAEQMTLWKHIPEKNGRERNALPKWQPKRHDPARQIWREFPCIASANPMPENEIHQPGVVRWLAALKQVGLYERGLARFQITATVYGDKDFFVNDSFSDTLAFHVDLLTELGSKWQTYIIAEIRSCEEIAKQLGLLAAELGKAAGGTAVGEEEIARRQFYFAVDVPFRKWLRDIDPERDDPEEGNILSRWRKEAKGIARQQAEEMVLRAGPAAFAGRTVKEKRNGKDEEHHYSAPEAYNRFLYRLSQIYKTE